MSVLRIIYIDYSMGGAIVQICSQCQTSNPDSAKTCRTCQAELSQWSKLAIALKELQENPRVSHIRISVSGDCCPACSGVEGVYSKDAIPNLPIEGCSHNLGCRCIYMPVLEELYP